MDISFDTIDVSPPGPRVKPPDGDRWPVTIRELSDAIPLALAIVDGNLRLVMLNHRMAARIGTSVEICVGRPVCEIAPPIAAQLETCIRRVLAGNPAHAGDDRLAVGSGEIHSFTTLRNEGGAIAGVLWAVQDQGQTVAVRHSVPDAQRILMAEDLSMNQQIIAEMLESAGYEVLTVADGVSAVNLVRQESVDLVLMDIEMPLMDGLEATRAIRELGSAGGIPVVAMTANQGPEQIAACRAAGMDAYICKPVDRTDLLSTVRKWLKSSQKIMPDRRNERNDAIDRETLQNIRNRFGVVQTERFINEVQAQLENVLLQLSGETESKRLASELHSLVSMGGHLGLRDLSARARALMVSLRGKTTNIGIATEQFRDSAMEALAALQHEQLPRMSGAAQVSERKTA